MLISILPQSLNADLSVNRKISAREEAVSPIRCHLKHTFAAILNSCLPFQNHVTTYM